MLTAVRIKNFKSHKDVRLWPLETVSLLMGRNNAGKSSALEAIYYALTPDNPKAAFQALNESRGILQDDYVWKSIFHGFNPSNVVEIELTKGDSASTLRIHPMVGSKVQDYGAEVQSKSVSAGDPDGLAFVHASPGSSQLTTLVTSKVGRGERKRHQSFLERASVSFIPARSRFDALAAAQRYSSLEVQGRHEPITSALRIVEPRLKGLKVLATSAGVELFADINESQLVPLSWMGEGMLRVITLLSAITHCSGGCVLVDEIENGLHYSIMEPLWVAVAETASALNAQVIAATHSDEMIAAAAGAMDKIKRPANLHAFRFDLAQGETRVADYDAQLIKAALESEQEVR